MMSPATSFLSDDSVEFSRLPLRPTARASASQISSSGLGAVKHSRAGLQPRVTSLIDKLILTEAERR